MTDAGGPCVPADLEWTRWQLPPDSPPLSNFIVDAGTAYDKVTGLTWQLGVYDWDGGLTPAQSVIYCAGLDAGAGGPWRVPTLIEVASIIDYSRSNPMLPPLGFQYSSAGQSMMTATTNPDPQQPTEVLGVRLTQGNTHSVAASTKVSVRCVR